MIKNINYSLLVKQLWRGGPHVQLTDYAMSPWVDPRDGIIVSGFWRSGTTWVQQLLSGLINAKTIFEPLDARVTLQNKLHPCLYIEKKPEWFQKTFMPFYEENQIKDNNFRSYMDHALHAHLPGKWVRRARRSPAEALKKRVVVKMVRGQLCLNSLSDTFDVPWMHVYRDPRAVAASITRAGWGNGWLTEIDLGKLLLEPEDGRSNYFSKWTDLIKTSVNLEPVVKIVMYWALIEKFVLEESYKNPSRSVLIRYESLTENPCGFLVRQLAKVGIHVDDSTALRVQELTGLPSPTSGPKRAVQPMSQKKDSWKLELKTSQIDSIEEIVSALDLSDRLVGYE